MAWSFSISFKSDEFDRLQEKYPDCESTKELQQTVKEEMKKAILSTEEDSRV